MSRTRFVALVLPVLVGTVAGCRVVVHEDRPPPRREVVYVDRTRQPPPPAQTEPNPAPPPPPTPEVTETPVNPNVPATDPAQPATGPVVTDPAPTPEEPAAAPVVVEEQTHETVATEAPPPPQQETIVLEERPAPGHIWIFGHWAWQGRWVWIRGHWNAPRRGYVWVQGHWEAHDGRWHWVGGHWVTDAQLTEERPALLVATAAPPPPYHEVVHIELRPSARYVWIHGHWAWNGHWFWIHGHWHLARAGSIWEKGHWEERSGRWHWIAGRWVVETQVTEESPGLLVATVAPPAPYQESIVIGLRPSPRHVWIHGHWAWHGHWYWVHGHWHLGRPGFFWINGHWEVRGGQWHWVSGHWVEEVKVTEERPGLVVATMAPPQPYPETAIVELRPAPHYVWLGGHWAWYGHWVWVHGHWHAPPRHGQVWVAGHWGARGGEWHWSVGFWR